MYIFCQLYTKTFMNTVIDPEISHMQVHFLCLAACRYILNLWEI